MARIRINFGVSEFMREWIKIQIGVVGIVEESINHIVIDHNMTGPQLVTFRSNFLDKLAEAV